MSAQSETSNLVCINVFEVAAMLGVSDAFVWLRAKADPSFPQPLKVGPKSTRWIRSQVQSWILAQLEGDRHA